MQCRLPVGRKVKNFFEAHKFCFFLSRLPMSRALVRGALAHPPNILVVFVMMPCEEGLRVHDSVNKYRL